MEWLNTRNNRGRVQVDQVANEQDKEADPETMTKGGAEGEDVGRMGDEAVSTPSARRGAEGEDTNRNKTTEEYNSPSFSKRKELMQARKSISLTATTVKTYSPKRKHRITPVMITEDETRVAKAAGQDGTKNLFQEYAEKAGKMGDGIDGLGEHWQTEEAKDDSEGEQYCKKNAEGEIVPIEEASEGEESGSQAERGEDEESVESVEEVGEDKMETFTSLQAETTTIETTDSAECHQLKQRVG